MDDKKIALTHASSLAAQAILEKLPESGLAPDSLILLDDESSAGTKLGYGDTYLQVLDQQDYSFEDCGLVLMPEYDASIESKLSKLDALLVSHTVDSDGAVVYVANRDAEINVSYTQASVRLAGPELSCLMGVLPDLHQAFEISRCNLVFLRSAEASGKAAVDELAGQTIELLNGREAIPSVFPLQIAFNMFPASQVSHLDADLVKLLGKSEISCIHQVANVPVFHGLAISVQLEFTKEASQAECRAIFNKKSAVHLSDGHASPISDCNQSFSCVINQLEEVGSNAKCIHFWMVVDPMRYGLANNYVHVIDILLKSYL